VWPLCAEVAQRRQLPSFSFFVLGLVSSGGGEEKESHALENYSRG